MGGKWGELPGRWFSENSSGHVSLDPLLAGKCCVCLDVALDLHDVDCAPSRSVGGGGKLGSTQLAVVVRVPSRG